MSRKLSATRNIGIIAVLLFSAAAGCGGPARNGDLVSIVDATNVSEQYVVIHAGRDQSIRVGDAFTLSREYYVTAHVDVFEVAETTCKARGYTSPHGGPTRIDDVRIGDTATLVASTTADKLNFLWLCAILIGLASGTLVVSWLGYSSTWNYVRRHKFWNSAFLSVSLRCLRVWFWLVFFVSALLIVTTTFQALFVDGLYIQNLMLLYPLAGVFMVGTFGVAWVFIAIGRRAP
jgi:hypothetical protein